MSKVMVNNVINGNMFSKVYKVNKSIFGNMINKFSMAFVLKTINNLFANEISFAMQC